MLHTISMSAMHQNSARSLTPLYTVVLTRGTSWCGTNKTCTIKQRTAAWPCNIYTRVEHRHKCLNISRCQVRST